MVGPSRSVPSYPSHPDRDPTREKKRMTLDSTGSPKDLRALRVFDPVPRLHPTLLRPHPPLCVETEVRLELPSRRLSEVHQKRETRLVPSVNLDHFESPLFSDHLLSLFTEERERVVKVSS